MARYLLFTALGMFLMYIILTILKKSTAGAGAGTSQTTENFKALARTMQASNLIKTNEFRELVKTTEFRNFVSTLAKEQINALTNSLI